MLEIIVSGQIPGTQIVITFQSVLAIASLALGIVIARQIAKPNRRSNSVKVEDIVI